MRSPDTTTPDRTTTEPATHEVIPASSPLSLTSAVRIWQRLDITALAIAYHLDSDLVPGLFGRVEVTLDQGSGSTTRALRLVIDDPDAACDLATALTWASGQLRGLWAAGAPATEQRAFGPSQPREGGDPQ